MRIWLLDPNGNELSTGTDYGPYEDSGGNPYFVRNMGVATDNSTRVAWYASSGEGVFDELIMWALNNEGVATSYGTPYGPYPGWSFIEIGLGPNGVSHVMWTKTIISGDTYEGEEMEIWTLGSTGAATSYGTAYGPYANGSSYWTPVGFDDNPTDGTLRLLWVTVDSSNNLSTALLWALSSTGTYTANGPTYGPYPNWNVHAMEVLDDGTARLFWSENVAGPGQDMVEWTESSTGTLSTAGPVYGPEDGWTADMFGVINKVSGNANVMWQYTDDSIDIWGMNSSGTEYSYGTHYGPYY
jgi:hypothetical protein